MTLPKMGQYCYCGVKRNKDCTEKNFDVGIAKLVWYNEQLIFAVILNARISHMNCLHK